MRRSLSLYGLTFSLPLLAWQLLFFVFPLLFLIALSFWTVRNFRMEPALDATRLQALLAGHSLLRHPNVVVTPHIAYATVEALGRILDTTLANIEAFARGEPRNLVALPSR